MEDVKTLSNLRNHAYKTMHVKNLVFAAQLQADIVWHEASKTMAPEIHKFMWDEKERGEVEKARRIAMRHFEVSYFDI